MAASFGRGFFILDDLTPLRMASPELLEQEAVLFPVRDPWRYVQKRIVHSQGASEYRAENPPFGAVFTYYLKEDLKSRKEQRKASEKSLEKQNANIPFPGWDTLEKEITEDAPSLLFTVKDQDGTVVNHVKAPAKKGIHRVSWNLRHASQRVVNPDAPSGFQSFSDGFLVTPGKYSVTMYSVQDGGVSQLAGEQKFHVKSLRDGVLEASSDEEIDQFRKELEAFQQEIGKVSSQLVTARKKIESMKKACFKLDTDATGLLESVYEAEAAVQQLENRMNGNRAKGEVGEKEPPAPGLRMMVAYRGLSTTYGPTDLHRESLELGKQELEPIRTELKKVTGEKALKEAGGPWIESP